MPASSTPLKRMPPHRYEPMHCVDVMIIADKPARFNTQVTQAAQNVPLIQGTQPVTDSVASTAAPGTAFSRQCTVCKKVYTQKQDFSSAQLKKPLDSTRCKGCVAQAEAAEAELQRAQAAKGKK